MINYQIELKRVIQETGEIVAFLNPVDNTNLTPIRVVVKIDSDLLNRLSNAPNQMSVKNIIRQEVIKNNSYYQYKWNEQSNLVNADIPGGLQSLEGEVLASPTPEEVDQPNPSTPNNSEVVL